MRGTQTPDYYHLLGLAPSATGAEIKVRYRALSKQHHPDVGGNQADMSRINHAYAVLSDKFKRAIYDAERRRQLQITAARPARTATAPTAGASSSATRPAPRSSASYGSITTKRSRWWPKIALAFASIVIIVGMLLHLPIAEAITSADTASSTSKPLEITYPSETSSQVVSNPGTSFYTAPDGTNYTAPTTPDPAPVAEPKSEAEKQAKSAENCQTKTYGPYQRTVCRDASGTKICSVNVLGGQRFGDCN
jgi:curved DNA-binding protein CbpA